MSSENMFVMQGQINELQLLVKELKERLEELEKRLN